MDLSKFDTQLLAFYAGKYDMTLDEVTEILTEEYDDLRSLGYSVLLAERTAFEQLPAALQQA